MSDLTATNCSCQRTDNCNNSCSSIIWIIILLFFCGGNCDNGCSNGFFGRGNDSGCGCEIIILILLLSCCGGSSFCF